MYLRKVFDMNIWNFWAKRYDKLWVQKYSLKPTRDYILSIINTNKPMEVLDLGCGPGELIMELQKSNPNLHITGLDFSEAMINISKKRNPKAKHILMDVAKLDKLKDKFDIIISTHSFPYYKDPKKAIKDLHSILEDGGKIHIGFASGDSFYDKLALFFVKFTTGPANYPSDKEFKELIKFYFDVEALEVIKMKKFMPRIAVYTLKKVQK